MPAKSLHKTVLLNLTKNEIVLRPKHGAPPPHFRKFMLQSFMTDMVAYMRGGMMVR